MTEVGQVIILIGATLALLASVGLHRFSSTAARLHAAGKASPVAFLVTAMGVGIVMGLDAAANLLVAVVAMLLTLPIGVHLLFRAVFQSKSERS